MFRQLHHVKTLIALAWFGSLVWLRVVCSQEHQWFDDPSVAMAKANGENKDLLLLFTGSDWCPPCKKLEEEVLSAEEFWKELGRDYVGVKFDFLRHAPLPPEVKRRNDEWQQRYGIVGFPTIVLVDRQWRPYGFVGYSPGGFDPFLGAVEVLRQKRIRRDAAWDAAAQAEGTERARLLDRGLNEMTEELARLYYEDLVLEIIELDADDELGLRSKWNAPLEAELRRIAMTDIMTLSRLEKPEKVVAFIDEVLQAIDFPLNQRFDILMIKLGLLQQSGNTAAALALLDELASLDGVTGVGRERLIGRKALLIAGRDGVPAALALVDAELAKDERQLHLVLTRVHLLARAGEHQQALAEIDRVRARARFNPDLWIELVAAQAESLCALGRTEDALVALEQFAEDQQMPADLRCEAMLQQAMIMRETGRRRPAAMIENRAVNTADRSDLKREISRVIEQIQKRFDQSP